MVVLSHNGSGNGSYYGGVVVILVVWLYNSDKAVVLTDIAVTVKLVRLACY